MARLSLMQLHQEGIVKYNGNMGNLQFVEQWITPHMYNEPQVEPLTCIQVKSIDLQKDRKDDIYVYCKTESIKQALSHKPHVEGLLGGPHCSWLQNHGERIHVCLDLKTTALEKTPSTKY